MTNKKIRAEYGPDSEFRELVSKTPKFFYLTRYVQTDITAEPTRHHIEYKVREFETEEQLTQYVKENGMGDAAVHVQTLLARRLESKIDVTLSE